MEGLYPAGELLPGKVVSLPWQKKGGRMSYWRAVVVGDRDECPSSLSPTTTALRTERKKKGETVSKKKKKKTEASPRKKEEKLSKKKRNGLLLYTPSETLLYISAMCNLCSWKHHSIDYPAHRCVMTMTVCA